MNPGVSVVIPVYNGARTIARAIASVRNQAIPDTEIVVVDDASWDDTREVLTKLAGDDMRVIALPKNGGVSRARNAGIAVARGEFVAFLDADDEWLPGKLERQIAYLREHPRAGLVGSHIQMLGTDGHQANSIFPLPGLAAVGPNAWRRLLELPYICTSVAVVRRDVLSGTGTFDERLRVGEDQDLWIRIALRHEIGFIEEVMAVKHERPDSLSRENALDGITYTLPMIFGHLERNRDRLSPQEVRKIMGARLAAEGRTACYAGRFGPGSRLLARAILMREDPAANLLFLLKTTPAIRWLKRQILGAAGQHGRTV